MKIPIQEMGIYSCVDQHSDEMNGDILKVFDNKNEVCKIMHINSKDGELIYNIICCGVITVGERYLWS